MTASELKRAFIDDRGVRHDGRVYPHINALIYRRGGRGIFIQAELLDTSSSVGSVYIVSPAQLERME